MYVASIGMISPVGLDAESSCAAIRAGIAMFEELPYIDNNGEPIVGAMVSAVDLNLTRNDRLVELLSVALLDCLNGGYSGPLDSVPLLVGLAEPERPGGSASLADNIVQLIEQKLNIRFHPQLSRAICNGNTAGFDALAVARDLFQNYHIPACVVCGVDSFINASSLSWLNRHWRLKTEENSDGVIPGEAAAEVLIFSNTNTSLSAFPKIIGLGFGNESASILTKEPLLGLGLTEASKNALAEARIKMHQIGFRISDVTGESYGFKEQALVVGRLLRVHREEGYPIWHPSENIGYSGAAVGIIQLVLSYHAYQKHYAPDEVAMCFSSSESGRRSVALLAANISAKAGSTE